MVVLEALLAFLVIVGLSLMVIVLQILVVVLIITLTA
jgi:hypothetical protein